jgi:biopolymer transport protein ExbB/TolQ
MSLEQAFTMFLLMLVAQIPLLVAAVINWLRARSNANAIAEIHKATNSMKDALVAAAGREGRTAGIAEQKAREKPLQSNEGMQ